MVLTGYRKEIDTDEILNFEGPQTNIIARYERIMRHREIEVMGDVSAKLFDLKRTIHQSSENLNDKITEFNETIQHASENLNDKITEFDKSQGKLQWITIALTVAIALSAIFYTCITWQSVEAQREANVIQRSILERNSEEIKELP
jgi:hypothetical protein